MTELRCPVQEDEDEEELGQGQAKGKSSSEVKAQKAAQVPLYLCISTQSHKCITLLLLLFWSHPRALLCAANAFGGGRFYMYR